jgi:CBS domain-containing protein
MNASDVMNGKPLSVAPDATIVEAAQLMLKHHISGLPVTDKKGSVIGIVTEGDLLHRAETGTERHRSRWLGLLVGPGRLAHDYVDAHARMVGEVMTTDMVVVSPQEPLERVVELMEKRHIKRVPVVAKGRLVGIVSRADLVRALLRDLTQKEASAKRPVSDADIRSSILAIIDKEPWGPRFSVDVTVEKGVAHLHGTVTDDRERTALKVAAENIPGVKSVRDHLVWVEPNSGLVIPAQGEED